MNPTKIAINTFESSINYVVSTPPPHCTEIDFALSFGAVLVKMIDLSKTESRDFFGIILGQENSQKLGFWFLTEEIQYHDGLRSRELGQAPILLCAPNS